MMMYLIEIYASMETQCTVCHDKNSNGNDEQ